MREKCLSFMCVLKRLNIYFVLVSVINVFFFSNQRLSAQILLTFLPLCKICSDALLNIQLFYLVYNFFSKSDLFKTICNKLSMKSK